MIADRLRRYSTAVSRAHGRWRRQLIDISVDCAVCGRGWELIEVLVASTFQLDLGRAVVEQWSQEFFLCLGSFSFSVRVDGDSIDCTDKCDARQDVLVHFLVTIIFTSERESKPL